MSFTPRISLAVLAAIALSGSCGGSKPQPAAQAAREAVASPVSAQSPAPARATASAAKKRNACAFVPLPLVEQIATEKLLMSHDIKEEDMTVCEVSSTKSKNTLVTVTVYWVGGKEVARTNQAAMSMAKQMLNEDDVDIEELTGSGKVRGLADKAFYSDVMPSWFLKGDVLVEVISPLFRHGQRKSVFTAIAKQAISEL